MSSLALMDLVTGEGAAACFQLALSFLVPWHQRSLISSRLLNIPVYFSQSLVNKDVL